MELAKTQLSVSLPKRAKFRFWTKGLRGITRMSSGVNAFLFGLCVIAKQRIFRDKNLRLCLCGVRASLMKDPHWGLSDTSSYGHHSIAAAPCLLSTRQRYRRCVLSSSFSLVVPSSLRRTISLASSIVFSVGHAVSTGVLDSA
ncbi:hypothetical protein PIB30_002792 [Stylosanthes scabra]|uniref:Uncharacterized protein n=1 Tax=Stylosanthes scabra TaxID=79078 RepID=A0ABU6S3K0_9FABA|nr:hypothetical protein [Stylosanthes scabra]